MNDVDALTDPDGSEGVHVELGYPGSGRIRRTTTRAIADLALGGTDGDGNVYSIDLDLDAGHFFLKCVGNDGSISIAGVQAGASISDVIAANGDETRILTSTSQMLAQFTPNVGTPHSLTVDGTGVSLDGVLCDPTAPWPGG